MAYAEGQSDAPLLAALENSNDYKSLVKKRAIKRQSLTKTINKITAGPCDTEVDINFYIQKLTTLLSEITELDGDIESYMMEKQLWSDGEYQRQCDVSENYSDKAQHNLLMLNSKLNNLTQAPAVQCMDNNNSSMPKLKLPQVPLPVFDGKPENYRRFIDSLDSMLNKFQLTSFEKYSYLRQQLTGPPKAIIESLSDENLSYEGAKALLESAFSDKTVQQFSVIESLSTLKLNSSQNFYLWISELRQLANQMERLQVDSSVFAQFFIWKNMGESFKKQFILVSNSAKPSLQNIIDNSFEVMKRMETMPSEIKNSQFNSLTLATGVNHDPKGNSNSKSASFNPKFNCGLCHSLGGDVNFKHKIYRCQKFSSPESKVKKIRELGGCTKCGILNHTLKDCYYKFTGTCANCKEYHAYFLCTNDGSSKQAQAKKSSAPGDGKKSNVIQSSTNATEFVVLQSQSPQSNVILPTFTSRISKFSCKGQKSARVLYDPASQSSFISEKCLKTIKHKVIKKHITAKIIGFNNSRTYTTKLVQFQCDIGGRNTKLSAVVVPDIGMKLNADKLPEIKSEFCRRSIDLADKHLNESQGIDILLGADQAHLIPVHSCRFGNVAEPSMIYYSSAGVLLAGNSVNLHRNLSNLKMVQDFIEKLNLTF